MHEANTKNVRDVSTDNTSVNVDYVFGHCRCYTQVGLTSKFKVHLSVHLGVFMFLLIDTIVYHCQCVLVILNYIRFCQPCQYTFCIWHHSFSDLWYQIIILPCCCTKNRQIARSLCIYGCQLPLWLTLNFTDLCISVYTYTTYGGVAHARPLSFQRFSTLKQKSTTICRFWNNSASHCHAKLLISFDFSLMPITVFLSVTASHAAQDHAMQKTIRKQQRRCIFCSTTPRPKRSASVHVPTHNENKT